MKQGKVNIDRISVEWANSRAKATISHYTDVSEKLKSDPDKKDRQGKQLCKACFYIYRSRVGGSAITNRPCGVCEENMTFSSTATDVMCSTCAKHNGLCRQCGSDMEHVNRRDRPVFDGSGS